jgi:hypothetical protein
VQGNILLGQSIIDTIKNVYLNTTGPLADRLMASLEAAMIIGADTRCASRGTSTRSSFVKVVRLGDGSVPYLQKIVPDSPVNTDPIGLLRIQFDQWKDSLSTVVDPFLSAMVADLDTLPANGTAQAVITVIPRNNSDTLLAPGLTVLLSHTGGGNLGSVTDLGNGTYAATMTAPTNPGTDTLSVRVASGQDTVRIASRVILVYTSTTSRRELGSSIPSAFSLEQSYPNPFNATSIIRFTLPAASAAELKVYDIAGKEVSTLVDGPRPSGIQAVQFDASTLGSGVYYYQLRVGPNVLTKKMTLLK